MRQLHRLTIASIIGISSIIAFNSAGESARRPPLSAILLGGNQVSATGAANVGDPDGVGSATIKITKMSQSTSQSTAQLCFGITVAGVDKPILTHIHEGAAGTNGPVVVDLKPPASGFSASSGCVNVPIALAVDINNDPLNYYVNLHTEKFPDGAVRGQLH